MLSRPSGSAGQGQNPSLEAPDAEDHPIPVRYNINAPTDSKVEVVSFPLDLKNLNDAIAPATGGRVVAVSDTRAEDGQKLFVYHVEMP